ncbi:MAG TPA: ester cyclase [Chloroflexota bacterium]|jgi:steroid delta-isomerase-like uncharacterized protein
MYWVKLVPATTHHPKSADASVEELRKLSGIVSLTRPVPRGDFFDDDELSHGEIEVTALAEDRLAARVRLVEEHVRLENLHDLDGIMRTFSENPRYDNEPMDECHVGMAAVRGFYKELLHAIPDLVIVVKNRYVTDEAIVLEVQIQGTHLGAWRGLPGTGRRLDYPLCGVYTFGDDDRLAGERIYYDRATVYRQLGISREPFSGMGRVLTALAHPVTVSKAYGRMLVAAWLPGKMRRRRAGRARA